MARGKGFGDVLLAHLKTIPQATTEELAKLAGVTLEQAYNRLMALSYEKRMISAGKGKNRAWSLPGGEPVAVATRANAKVVGIVDRRNHGWKPDLTRFELFDGQIKVGDKLLVEYPEEWRHTMLCSVTRADGYFGQQGLAQVWNLREDCFGLVDWSGFAARGWKIARVKGEKDLEKLATES
jgi:hypothetical protein